MPHQSTLHELTRRVHQAAATGQPLRIRGGGSKDFYGERLEGTPLDTRALTGIVSYPPSELVITARAGTPLAELEAALAEQGQYLPFEPPYFDEHTTVGGMVASGLSGPARACVGGVRDYVLGLALLNGRAEHLRFGGQVMKNVAGYDVSRLMVGALGTLGLITEVSLKVLPVAPAQATLRFDGMDEATALRALNGWASQPLPLNASAWEMQARRPTLRLRLRGAHAAVRAASARLRAEQPGARILDPAEADAGWRTARDLGSPWFEAGLARGQDLWRLSVPGSAPPLGLGDTRIEWLGAQRWVWADPADAAAAQRLRSTAAAVGGNATLFIANNPHQTRDLRRFDTQTPALAKIQREIKRQFDPAGIFNPGRLDPDF